MVKRFLLTGQAVNFFMKGFVTIVFIACMHAVGIAQSPALEKKINLSLEKIPVLDVMNLLSQQSHLKFTYGNNIDLSKNVTVNFDSLSLNEALTKLFTPLNIKWELVGNQLALLPGKKINLKIFGSIIDSVDKSPIQFANVYLKNTYVNISTNFNGKFIFESMTEGTYTLVINMFGYKSQERQIELNDNSIDLTIILTQNAIKLTETIVVSDKIIERSSVSQMEIGESQIQAGRGITNDPMNSLSALPGVLGRIDLFGSRNLYIRGGESFENQFLLDNIRLPFPFYFVGQSIFNPDMLEKAEVLTGGFSPNYGHSMSSVFNLTTKSGNTNHMQGNVDLSVLNASAQLQEPIIKNKLSFIVGARKNNFEQLTINSHVRAFFMADATSKITYTINEKNKMSLTTLNVLDNQDFTHSTGLQSAFKGENRINAQNLQLQSIIGKKTYSKASFLHSGLNTKTTSGELLYKTVNDVFGFREDLTIYPRINHKIKAGFEVNLENEHLNIFDYYKATDIATIDSSKLIINLQTKTTKLSNAAYVFYDGTLFKRLLLNLGARFDYNQQNNQTDISPRLTVGYELAAKSVLSLSWGVFNQSPLIYQVIKNPKLKSNQCQHTILSFKQKISNALNGRVEAYYKNYTQLVMFDSTSALSNNGFGVAKGIEFFLVKESGAVTGWVSYALAESDRRRNLQDRSYPFYFDQRNSLNVILNYRVKNKLKSAFIPCSYSLDFRYATGTPYTPVTGVDTLSGKYEFVTGQINSSRNPNFSNLNLKIEWQYYFGKQKQNLMQFYVHFWNVLSSENLINRNYVLNKSTQTISANNSFTTKFFPNIGLKINFY